MLSIDAIAYALPEQSFHILKDSASLHLSKVQAKVYHRLYGLTVIPIDTTGNVVKLILQAVKQIITENIQADIKYLIHAHTGSVVDHFGHSVVRSVKQHCVLPRAQAFASSFNKCTTLFSVLSWIEFLLQAESPNAKALLITADLAFSQDLRVVAGITIIGDAAGAMIVSLSGKYNRVLDLKQIIDGRFAMGIWLKKSESMLLEKVTVKKLCDLVKQLLTTAKLSIDQIACILPHNTNVPSWHQIAKHLNLDIKKIYLANIAKTSHCFCTDFITNYLDAKKSGFFKTGDKILVLAIGVGAVFSGVLIEC